MTPMTRADRARDLALRLLRRTNVPGLSAAEWYPEALDAWATGENVSIGERHVVRCVLNGWDRTRSWRCGPFEFWEAIRSWDDQKREAFASWTRDVASGRFLV